jgi:hypothetical protein
LPPSAPTSQPEPGRTRRPKSVWTATASITARRPGPLGGPSGKPRGSIRAMARAKRGVNYLIGWGEFPSQLETESPMVWGRTKDAVGSGGRQVDCSWAGPATSGSGGGETWRARAKGGSAKPKRAMGGRAATPWFRAVSSVGGTIAATSCRRGGGRTPLSSCVHGTRNRSRSTSDSAWSSRECSDHLASGAAEGAGPARAGGARVVRQRSIGGGVRSTRTARTKSAGQ